MLKQYLESFKTLLFPLTCLYCARKISQNYLCLSCQAKIKFLKPPRCRFCCQPLAESPYSTCRPCSNKLYPYQRAISATEYKQPLINLIQLLKYQHCDYLSDFLSGLMIQHLKAIGFVSYYHDYIISVPMHRDKLKMRGYNQSQLLAKALSNHFKIPLNNDIIEVTKLRPSQTKLTKLDRTPNVEGIFRASSKAKNLNFLLVDDIFTSGATIAACSKSLKEKGANIVTVITLAKTTQ